MLKFVFNETLMIEDTLAETLELQLNYKLSYISGNLKIGCMHLFLLEESLTMIFWL